MTITSLTIRQFLRSRSVIVLVGVCILAIIFAALPQIATTTLSLRDKREIFSKTLFLGFFSATLLPLGILVLSTSAIGDEIEDRTLQYLALKPISRFAIVFQKFVAVLVVTLPVVLVGVTLMWAVIGWGDYEGMRDLLTPALTATVIAVLGFGSLFLLVSMVVQRALIVGVMYVFVWESALSRYLPGIKAISIRHFSQSMFVRMADDRRITLSNASAESTVIITIVVLCVVCLLLATLRLRKMSLE